MTHALPWGCICREVDGLVEGVLLGAHSLGERPRSRVGDEELVRAAKRSATLRVSDELAVRVARKAWADWRHINDLVPADGER